jgi:hypothetical protein
VDVISAGGTGTYDLNSWATEIQAGFLRADGHGLRQARPPLRPGALGPVHRDLRLRGLDGGRLRAQGIRYGPRQPSSVEGAEVWFCSDEHLVFNSGLAPSGSGTACGCSRRTSTPPWRTTNPLYVVDGDEVVDRWDVDLRGW